MTYADNRRSDLEFELGDKVYFKISLIKRIMIFCKKGKHSPLYVFPYEIVQRVCKVAYHLRLPSEPTLVHPVFHAFMLKKCIVDPEFIIPIERQGVDEILYYEDVLVQILDRNVYKLRNKEVASIKVLWRNNLVEGATWEAEANMKSRYPHLLP
ncbi:hypothetical protein EJD97_023728 [Solanum chilense]|uniref:Tf2-1-like SH3-like domain-containing protein n=1 Tax=Solanum chilense TaxID=4083 RepID=A0A6N2C5J8_SOLCI|nr:hypothetical protein EJD97_023728 [Solanum chilense]